MMKKYNKPEIVTLALETVDVIAASEEMTLMETTVASTLEGANATKSTPTVKEFTQEWSW